MWQLLLLVKGFVITVVILLETTFTIITITITTKFDYKYSASEECSLLAPQFVQLQPSSKMS